MFTRSWKNPAVIPHFPHAVVLFLCFCKSLESIVLINFIYALTPIFVFTSHNQSFLWHYTLMITINLQSNFLVLHPFITSAFNVVDLCFGIVFFSWLPCHLALPVFSFHASCYLTVILLPLFPLSDFSISKVIQGLVPNPLIFLPVLFLRS